MNREMVAEALKNSVRVTDDGCWEWTGCIDKPNGYALLWDGPSRKYVRAHSAVYQQHVGPVPEGLVLDHVCHSLSKTCVGGGDCLHRRCVNPDHLEAVTVRENTMRGLGPSAINAQKTHCIHGHEFSEDNTYWYKGRRQCRECNRALWRAKQARRAARRRVCEVCGLEVSGGYIGRHRSRMHGEEAVRAYISSLRDSSTDAARIVRTTEGTGGETA